MCNGCRKIVFNSFQNGDRPSAWIIKNLKFLTNINVCGGGNVCHHAKFRQNWPNGFELEDITIS